MLLHLTASNVARLEPHTETYVARDTKLPGFGCRVTKEGVKSWVVEYRVGAGGRSARKRQVTLGRLATVAAPHARQRAAEILARARMGEDVAEAKAEQRRQAKFSELAEEYLTTEAAVVCKASTVSLYRMLLRKHVQPKIGSRRTLEVTKSVLLKLHRELGESKPATANRVLTFVSGIFTWAIKGEILPAGTLNPATGISKFSESGRERYLKSDELGRLGEALRELETVGIPWSPIDAKKTNAKHAPKPENRFTKPSPMAAAAIELLIYTGCRLREILHLRWHEVDLERGLLFLPDSKTGRKTIQLNSAAIGVLSSLKRIGEFVIPGSDFDGHRADLKRPWATVCRRAGLEGVRLHDLRHTYASIGAGMGLGLQIIGKLLSHSDPSTTEKYAHLDALPIRRASNEIGSALSELLGNQKQEVHQLPVEN